jgi:hypothetical protein
MQELALADLVYSLVHIAIIGGQYNRPKAAVLRRQSHPITTTNLQSLLFILNLGIRWG